MLCIMMMMIFSLWCMVLKCIIPVHNGVLYHLYITVLYIMKTPVHYVVVYHDNTCTLRCCIWWWCVTPVHFGVLQSLLMSTNTWSAPRLIELPNQYYQIFQSYSQRTCVTCGEVPNDPAICLVCANYTCFRQNCCTQQGVSECVHVSHLSTGCHLKSLG